MIRDTIDRVKSLIFGRAFAYNHVFKKENAFAQVVLRDLAKFCRAYETTFSADPRIHAAMEGRREVWLRIQEHLQLTPDHIYDLHHIKFTKEEKK